MRSANVLLQGLSRGGYLGKCGLLFLLLLLSLLPARNALAQCTVHGSSPGNQGSVTFSPPSTITVPANTKVNTVLWTSTSATPNPATKYDCYGTVNYGVVNNVGANPGANVTYFPTGVSGLSYVITHSGSPLYSWPNSSENVGGGCFGTFCIGGETITFNVPSILQLVATGPIANGSTLQAGTLAHWQWQGFGTNPQIEAFVLANPVKFVTPACSVTTNPINVKLATIISSALGGTGSTAGTVAFNIGLNCPSDASGMKLSIELDYNGNASGIQGVLLPTGGSIKGVGVQVLDKSSKPVTFGTPEASGTTPTGQMNIPYYARYYQTGAITPGSLTASATFTISYQ